MHLSWLSHWGHRANVMFFYCRRVIVPSLFCCTSRMIVGVEPRFSSRRSAVGAVESRCSQLPLSALPFFCRRLNSFFNSAQPALLARAFSQDILSLRGSRFRLFSAFSRGLLTMAWRSRGCRPGQRSSSARCPWFCSSSGPGKAWGGSSETPTRFPEELRSLVGLSSCLPLKIMLLPMLWTHGR